MDRSITEWIIAISAVVVAIGALVTLCGKQLGILITEWGLPIAFVIVVATIVFTLIVNNSKVHDTNNKPPVKPKACGVFAVIVAAAIFTLSMFHDSAKARSIRTFMIDEDTRITKTSENRVNYSVQNNSEIAIQKIVWYLGKSEVQDEIIKDAIQCARNNNYIFSKRIDGDIGVKDFENADAYVEGESRIPVLLTETERNRIILRVATDNGLKKNVMTLMRSVLSDEKIMRNLVYQIPRPTEVVNLGHYDKLGIICAYINSLKALPQSPVH